MPLIMPNGDSWDTALLTAAESAPLYSNDARTATANGVSYVQNLTPQTAGRWYGELAVSYPGPADDAYRVGVAAGTSPVSRQFADRLLGDDAQSLGWTAKGNVTSLPFVSNAMPYQSGDILGIACDFDRALVWFRVNGAAWAAAWGSDWGDERNSTDPAHLADPAGGLGGAAISGLGTARKYIGVMLPAGASVTIAALAYAPPAGYLPWLNPPGADWAWSAATLPLPAATGVMFTGAYRISSSVPGARLGRPGAQSAVYAFDPDSVVFPIDRTGAQARVNLFDVPIVVHLTLTHTSIGTPVRMNYPINRTDFHLIRGVPNVIQFFIRDVDRHIAAGPLANATLTLAIVDPQAHKLLLNQELLTIDAATALYALATQPTLPTQPVKMRDWPAGPLRYSVLVRRADGTESLLWTDRNYTPYGICRLLDGPLPGPVQPVVLDPADFLAQDGLNYSTPVAGAAALGYPDGLQTFSFSTTNFTADVVIQASLVAQPSSDLPNWFAVQTVAFTAMTGVTAVNVIGNFLWLRVAVPNTNPLPYPGTPLYPPPYGSVDLIRYLN